MKRLAISLAAILLACSAGAQDIVKTGLNFGPLPAIAFDADKGFQYGGILQIFNYGDGTNYPNFDSKLYLEASFFTKGSKLFTINYDNKELIPGVRWTTVMNATLDKAYDFYGFNGYESYYDYGRIASGKAGEDYLYSPYYRMEKNWYFAKTDFVGHITDNLYWEAGLHANYTQIGSINRESINKGKEDSEKFPDAQPTLYDKYCEWGIISPEEANGGFTASLRFGLQYDTRDKEGAPSRGIWAEGHLIAAPSWLGTKNEYYRYSATWRQYFPLIKNDVLTFAYRLNYEGTIGKSAPFYATPYLTVMGESYDRDGFGGYRTVRGIMRSRVMGMDTFAYNAELRWRFLKFHAFNQNIALGLSAFSDGAAVTRRRDMGYKGPVEGSTLEEINHYLTLLKECRDYRELGAEKDVMHVTFGAGFRFIMNENFIVAAEYGTPLTHFLKNSPLYNQDGTGAFYINIGYLF